MKHHFIKLILSASVAIFLSSCEGDNPEPPKATIKGIQLAEDAKFGKILTDADGKTLYFFSNDADGSSTCTGDCLVNWPVYYSADQTTDANVDKSEIGVITRADGSKQSTYNGWPLYYVKNDTQAKETKGDKFQNVWYVAKPDYTVMVANKQLVGGDSKNYIQSGEGTGKTLYLTDDKGRTFYAFKNDFQNKNKFTKEDFSNDGIWPISQKEAVALPSYVDKSLISKTTVFGKTQMTYKGWPLYYFGQDTKRGETKGVSQPSFGIWPIVNATTTPAVVEPVVEEKVTYQNFAEALFQTNCSGCHTGTGGGTGKWVFAGYESVKNNADKIKNAVLVTGAMPLGGSLSNVDKEKLKKWFDTGLTEK